MRVDRIDHISPLCLLTTSSNTPLCINIFIMLCVFYIFTFVNTVFARSVAAATNVFNLSRREATIQERLLFESGVYLFDCAPQELNDYVMVFVNV